MRYTLLENRPPLKPKPSWSLRLAMFLLSRNIPLTTVIIIVTLILFIITAFLVWGACQ